MASADIKQGYRLPSGLSTTAQAARALGVSERLVRSMCARGEVRAVKCGRVWRVNMGELYAAVGLEEAQQDAPAAE
jgi:excisionase family DNA binding protein